MTKEPKYGSPAHEPQRLFEMRYPEVADYLQTSDVAIVPCGATEQHGQHLPVGVDAMTAIAVAEEAAATTGTLVVPPLWYGWSPHHMGFPGTVSLRPETLTGLAEDVMISLLHHGFKRIVLVNGHRLANLPPLSIAVSRVRALTGAVAVVADLGHLAQPEYAHALANEGAGGIGHADGYETAHMMYIHPELVAENAVPQSDAPTDSHGSLRVIDPSVASTRAAWWPSTEVELLASGGGASGHPAWGSRERGQVLHGAMVRDLVTLINQVRETPAVVHVPEAPR